MNFEQLKTIQKEAYRLLQNSFYLDKLSHAYLFEGFTGCGKDEMAIYMAMQLVCSGNSKPCFECSDCKKVLYGNHLNVITIKPDSEVIKKEQIDELIHEFSMSSIEGGNQVYIIFEAEKMNASASNALLKFLEEPLINRYGFLITSNKAKILPTIISRTQVVHFKSISNKEIVETLKINGIDEDIAYSATSLTNNYEEIQQYISEGKLIDFVNIAKKIVKATIKNEDPFVVYYLNKNLFQEENKKWHRFFFDVLAKIYQEALKIKNGLQPTYYKDVFKNIESINININKKLELILESFKRLNYYISMPLFYTNFFCELGKDD